MICQLNFEGIDLSFPLQIDHHILINLLCDTGLTLF